MIIESQLNYSENSYPNTPNQNVIPLIRQIPSLINSSDLEAETKKHSLSSKEKNIRETKLMQLFSQDSPLLEIPDRSVIRYVQQPHSSLGGFISSEDFNQEEIK